MLMNKNYRLTKNSKTDQVQVAPETAKSHTSQNSGVATPIEHFLLSTLSTSFRVLSVALLILGLSAGISQASTYTVTSSTDDGTGTLSGSLSWAILQANAGTGSTVSFNVGASITPTGPLPEITAPITFSGVGYSVIGGTATPTLSIADTATQQVNFYNYSVMGSAGSNGANGANGTGVAPGGNGTAGGNGGDALYVTGGIIDIQSGITGGSGGYGGSGGRTAAPGGQAGGNGGVPGSFGTGVTGSNFTLDNEGDVYGGYIPLWANGGGLSGGQGGRGNATRVNGGNGGNATSGSDGGIGISGSNIVINSSGAISGGAGMYGGSGGMGGASYSSSMSANGGNGGNAGSGGNGGVGISGSDLTLTNSGTYVSQYFGLQAVSSGGITGGDGGIGGNGGHGIPGTSGGIAGTDGLGGNGGDGGIAIYGINISVTNTSTGGIAGGHGGNSGQGNLAGQAGNGGDAIYVTNLTMNNDGQILGGIGGSGNGNYSITAVGNGGTGGDAVNATGHSSFNNTGSITGGTGGNETLYSTIIGNGGIGGNGVVGSGFDLSNTSSGTVSGGYGGNCNGNTICGLSGAGGAGIVSTGNSTIDNFGIISGGLDGDGAVRADAVVFSGGGNTLIIEAGSVINGNVVSTSAAGSDILALGGDINASGGNTFDLGQLGVQYQGFSTYGKQGTSTWTLTGTGGSVGDSWTVSAGTLGLADSTSLTGDVSVLSGATLSSATAGITGNVSNGGTLSVGNATTPNATLTITGNFTNTGTFSPAVASMASYGKLSVSGTATLTGSTLDVNVIGSPTLSGSLTSIIHAGMVSGSFGTVTDNSTLFNFTPVYTATDVNLTISAASTTGVLTAVTNQGNTPAVGAATILDNIIATDPTGTIGSLFVPLTSNQQVSNAASQTLPLLTGGGTLVEGDLLGDINRVIEARNNANQGLSSGDNFYGDKKFWLKPFGTWADQNDRDAVAGYKARIGGLALGADVTLSTISRVGVALAYAHANVDSNSSVAPQTDKIDLYQLIGYGSFNLDPQTEINYQVDVGNNSNSGQRDILFAGETANASYNAFTAHAGIGIGRVMTLSPTTNFVPSVRIDYTSIHDNAYSETGAGALNLNVDSHTTEQLVFSLDGKLTHDLGNSTKLMANLGAGYDTMAEQASITAAYAGAPGLSFATLGLTPSHWLWHGGLGVEKTTVSGMQVVGRYDVEGRNGYTDQTVSAKLRWTF